MREELIYSFMGSILMPGACLARGAVEIYAGAGQTKFWYCHRAVQASATKKSAIRLFLKIILPDNL